MPEKRKPFTATCDRCQQESDRCLTVVLRVHGCKESWRQLINLCPGCRKTLSGQWQWPTPTSDDAAEEEAAKMQDQQRPHGCYWPHGDLDAPR